MKNLLTILLAVFLIVNTFLPRQAIAQVPEKMKYQAVIRDSNGHVVTNQAIGMQISILQGDLPGTVVYTETQSLLSNAHGLTSTEIGTGTVVLGDFSTIDWANGPYFLQIETDPTGGTNYTVTGTNQLLSVPYAIHSKTADSLTDIDSFSWSTTGNAGTDPVTNFIGTTDNQALIFKVNNIRAGEISTGTNSYYGLEAGITNTIGVANTGTGFQALYSNTTGNHNTASGKEALFENTSGQRNTAIGSSALQKNETGHDNTAIGFVALYNNTTGVENTATGRGALFSNTSGDFNTANGKSALYYNTTGYENTAYGYKSLVNNSTGYRNTAYGFESLYSNTTGLGNTAIGVESLYSNTTGNLNTANGRVSLKYNTIGSSNTANGDAALILNTIGDNNTATGASALWSNTSGYNNTATGLSSLFYCTTGYANTATGMWALYLNTTGSNNTATGWKAMNHNTTGDYNTASGYTALNEITTGSNNTGIGYDAQVPSATGSNQVRIGNEDVSYAGIQVPWSITSDEIWKEQIRELPYGIDLLMQLKPVDYYRKNNKTKTREMGFIAQDIEVLLKEIGYNDQGFLTKADNGNLSLRYNDFIALLTNAIQEQQQIILQQTTEIITQNENYKQLLQRIEQLEQNNNQ